MSGAAPYERDFQVNLPALGATTSDAYVICEAPFDGELVSAEYIPDSNVTGVDANTRTLTVVNAGQDGNGSTVMATLALVSGVDPTDFNATAFTLSAVEGAIEFEEGDVLKLASTHSGTGLAEPGGAVKIVVGRA